MCSWLLIDIRGEQCEPSISQHSCWWPLDRRARRSLKADGWVSSTDSRLRIPRHLHGSGIATAVPSSLPPFTFADLASLFPEQQGLVARFPCPLCGMCGAEKAECLGCQEEVVFHLGLKPSLCFSWFGFYFHGLCNSKLNTVDLSR